MARADFIVDDFDAPSNVRVPVITLLDPDPTLVKTADAAIMGGERDLLLDVKGTPSFATFIGQIGGGSFVFNGSNPGTSATLQYDALDADVVGPPAALVNAEGLGGMDLTAYGQGFSLDFDSADGGAASSTGIVIEVHSPSAVSVLSGSIADSGSPTTFAAPFSAFSDPSVFTNVTSVEVRINPEGKADVDFTLDTIRVPEPATTGLLASGLVGLVAFYFARRRA